MKMVENLSSPRSDVVTTSTQWRYNEFLSSTLISIRWMKNSDSKCGWKRRRNVKSKEYEANSLWLDTTTTTTPTLHKIFNCNWDQKWNFLSSSFSTMHNQKFYTQKTLFFFLLCLNNISRRIIFMKISI